MNIADKLKGKKIGGLLGLLVLGLLIGSLVVYIIYATSVEGLMMPVVIVLLALAIVSEILLFLFDNDFCPIITSGLAMASFGTFLFAPPETIGSVVDYIQDIVMFGNPDKFGIIIAFSVIVLIAGILSVVRCFMDRIR